MTKKELEKRKELAVKVCRPTNCDVTKLIFKVCHFQNMNRNVYFFKKVLSFILKKVFVTIVLYFKFWKRQKLGNMPFVLIQLCFNK